MSKTYLKAGKKLKMPSYAKKGKTYTIDGKKSTFLLLKKDPPKPKKEKSNLVSYYNTNWKKYKDNETLIHESDQERWKMYKGGNDWIVTGKNKLSGSTYAPEFYSKKKDALFIMNEKTKSNIQKNFYKD